MKPDIKRGRRWGIGLMLVILLAVGICVAISGCARRPPTLSDLLGEPVPDPDNSNYWRTQ